VIDTEEKGTAISAAYEYIAVLASVAANKLAAAQKPLSLLEELLVFIIPSPLSILLRTCNFYHEIIQKYSKALKK